MEYEEHGEYNLEKLIDMYGEKLLRYATAILNNHQDAEDIVQDVFLSVYKKYESFDGANISAWLYKITYNQSINKLKRRKLFIFGDIPEDTVAPEDAEFSDNTLEALSKLKPEERALLYAKIVEGYDYDELAKQMNKSPATLRKRYERARKKLAKYIKSECELKGVAKT